MRLRARHRYQPMSSSLTIRRLLTTSRAHISAGFARRAEPALVYMSFSRVAAVGLGVAGATDRELGGRRFWAHRAGVAIARCTGEKFVDRPARHKPAPAPQGNHGDHALRDEVVGLGAGDTEKLGDLGDAVCESAHRATSNVGGGRLSGWHSSRHSFPHSHFEENCPGVSSGVALALIGPTKPHRDRYRPHRRRRSSLIAVMLGLIE
jgi:hypothetical protein